MTKTKTSKCVKSAARAAACRAAAGKPKACGAAAGKPKARKAAAKAVTFTVRAEKGQQVYLAGCFNGWDPTAKKMTGGRDGVFSAKVKLAPGTYQYKFVVDGVWQADPQNADFAPNDMGTFNSVITVR